MASRKPNVEWSSHEGYHQFRNEEGEYGSFEIFWNDGELEGDNDNEKRPVGWYWWACFPGCLPDGEPNGPYNGSGAAYRAAREY